jgi:hypothetical protein
VLPFVFAPNGLIFGINPWGFFACVGLWVWLHFAERRVRAEGLDLGDFRAAVPWVASAVSPYAGCFTYALESTSSRALREDLLARASA